MVAELGNISLVLALLMAISLAIYPLWGAQKDHLKLMQMAKPRHWYVRLYVVCLYLFNLGICA